MPDETRPTAPAGWTATVLRTLAICGHGIWTLLGLGLALGVYSSGRGESLVPLLLGAVFASAGPLLASLGAPWLRGWTGWWIERGGWPSREAMLALATYLPMLGVAGLARGSNDFWATRLLGAVLAACSLASMAYAAPTRRVHRLPGLLGRLPLGRMITSWYGGGLWLLLCVVSQDPAVRTGDIRAWVAGLLLAALLLVVVEGLRWPSIAGAAAGRHAWWMRRSAAALLTYALPCLGLLMLHGSSGDRWLMLAAALSCVLGRSLERRLYANSVRNRGTAATDTG